ncbi:putative sorbitol dehydrogenase protein [Eutypa lata UCREL1]|uniref:L-arabinitol 4-dehydrogenase n=1 Tax=Eutypa lata (strain UCR-EL1) TaxID=1287681 RepID=M7T7Y2_EUTLA|nr:putative sorbitol dehydrogenase protein [Eutypa lata UCREL1]
MIGTVTDDHTIGIANGKLNGSSNGITNGHTNGHTNGLTNGATNGHANGHCDTEHAKTDAYNFRNPSLFVTPDHQLKMVDGPIEQPGPGEVTLQIKCSGICGSDVHLWKSGRIGSLEVKGECILGHEAAGVVLKCGEGVTNLKIGDRVGVEPQAPCEKCFLCREGRYNLCEDVKFSGIWPDAGTIQRYKVHPAKWLYKIPDGLTYSEGALLEPLSVILHGMAGANVKLGRPALICGAGPIGLVALAAARASGAHPLVITDVNAERLDFAKKFVPNCQTYQIKPKLSAQETAAEIRELYGEDEYSMPASVIECTGVEGSVCTACYCVRRGGTLMVIGVGRPIMNNVPFMHLSLAEIDLKFINRYRDTWPAAIQCMKGGVVDLNPMVTHMFPLERAVEAFELQTDPTKFSIKIHITDEVEALVDPLV